MSKMTKTTFLALLATLLVFGCKSNDEDALQEYSAQQRASTIDPGADEPGGAYQLEEESGGDYDEAPNAAAPEAVMATDKSSASGYGAKNSPAPKKRAKEKDRRDANDDGLVGGKGGGRGEEQGPAPRAWFPETFLFNPLVVTDDTGSATVDVRVPDRLTAWRVLALAHSRNGAQAGSTATFQGTLEAYVDPVVPSFLRVGDTVNVPVQLVNNSEKELQTTLKVEVEGGTLLTTNQSVSVPARSSALRYVSLQATVAGEIRLMARMGNEDMVVRTIPVSPTGKPVDSGKRGTLAAPRKFSVTGAEASGVSKGRARLAVYPGALALLRSELGAAMHRGTMASDAFALLLAGRAPALLQSLGDEADPEALRKLTIMATQKVMKHTRVLDVVSATLIAEAALSHPGNPVLERLGIRAISTIEAGQSPDGTCGGQSGWTLQRLLVSTADCARAAHDSPSVTIRASGAFERHAKEISDPYTAAAILAAGAAQGELKNSLSKIVLSAVKDSHNGAKVLEVPGNVRRADGTRPTSVESTALAVLALADIPDAPLADLGATILASYSPQRGWGDGRTNLVCMEAAMLLFKDPIPESVKILLRKDGEVVAEGELERTKVREVLNLSADGLDISGSHKWEVSAEPAVPGLGFSLTLTSWVPWTHSDSETGAELLIELPKEMKVGQAVALPLVASVPGGMSFQIELDLPAGVQTDRASLDALVSASKIQKYKVLDGKVTLFANPLAAGKRLVATVKVIPTLGGGLQSGPATIRVGGQESHLSPQRWLIK
jgi:hypothetical protein